MSTANVTLSLQPEPGDKPGERRWVLWSRFDKERRQNWGGVLETRARKQSNSYNSDGDRNGLTSNDYSTYGRAAQIIEL